MSIYIKNLNKPVGDEVVVLMPDGAALLKGYPQPLETMEIIEVPEHGRLIDADELMRRIQLYIDEYELYVDENGFHCEKWCAMKETEMAINDAPTVISADKDGET